MHCTPLLSPAAAPPPKEGTNSLAATLSEKDFANGFSFEDAGLGASPDLEGLTSPVFKETVFNGPGVSTKQEN